MFFKKVKKSGNSRNPNGNIKTFWCKLTFNTTKKLSIFIIFIPFCQCCFCLISVEITARGFIWSCKYFTIIGDQLVTVCLHVVVCRMYVSVFYTRSIWRICNCSPWMTLIKAKYLIHILIPFIFMSTVVQQCYSDFMTKHVDFSIIARYMDINYKHFALIRFNN